MTQVRKFEQDEMAQWVEKYIDIKAQREALKKEFATRDAPYAEQENLLSGLIMTHLRNLGIESARTRFGTVFFKTTSAASLFDPDAFMTFVINSQRFEMLDRKANKTAVRDYINEFHELPPGVKYQEAVTLGHKSPTNKGVE
jgi:hypothetical protein